MPDTPSLGIILAAGIGSRLSGYTSDRPKALVAIGPNGETVLEHLAARCHAVGVDELLVVTGHASDAVDAFIARWDAPMPVRTVFNPDYATMNNGQSLYVTRPLAEGRTFIKFDGDLVLHSAILPRLVAPGAPRSAIVLDDTKSLVDEDLKATIDEVSGQVTGLGKWLPNDSSGVSIGVERIDAADATTVFDALHALIHVQGQGERYYEDAYHTVLGAGLTLGHVTTGGHPWIEIDTEQELFAGRDLIARFASGDAR